MSSQQNALLSGSPGVCHHVPMTALQPGQRHAAEAFIVSSAETIGSYLDPAHHTFVDLYLGRADCLHALGQAPPVTVLRELAGASRCFAAHCRMYLQRWPVTRIRTRRLTPLELAAIVGDPDVVATLGAG